MLNFVEHSVYMRFALAGYFALHFAQWDSELLHFAFRAARWPVSEYFQPGWLFAWAVLAFDVSVQCLKVTLAVPVCNRCFVQTSAQQIAYCCILGFEAVQAYDLYFH